MASQVSRHIEELRQAATYAALNYEIWWVYKSSDTRPVYVDTMSRYAIFFSAGIHAHFVAMITALYRIYETRTDTHNFSTLLDAIATEWGSSDGADEYRQRFSELKPIWVKVSRLRNEAFSHRNLEASIREVFDSAKVTPDEFKHLIKETQSLLNNVSSTHAGSVHAFNTGAREDTLRMLDDLKSVAGGA